MKNFGARSFCLRSFLSYISITFTLHFCVTVFCCVYLAEDNLSSVQQWTYDVYIIQLKSWHEVTDSTQRQTWCTCNHLLNWWFFSFSRTYVFITCFSQLFLVWFYVIDLDGRWTFTRYFMSKLSIITATFCTSCHRVSRDLEPPSSGVSAGVGPTNDSRHWRHQGGNWPVPAAVSGSTAG